MLAKQRTSYLGDKTASNFREPFEGYKKLKSAQQQPTICALPRRECRANMYSELEATCSHRRKLKNINRRNSILNTVNAKLS